MPDPINTNPANASANPSALDLVLEHFMNVLYFDLGRYLIAAGVMTVIIWVCKRWASKRQIQNRKATRKDYVREVGSSLRTVVVFGVTTLATLVGTEMGLINLRLDGASILTIAWQFALIVFAHDAYFYWAHRAMHSKRLFKATHLHHHKSRTPTPWTAYSFSAWEAAIEAAFVPMFLLITSMLGMTYVGFAMLFFLWHMIIRNVMGHAGHELFPAGWVDNPLTSWISTTTHHDLHHSSGHNFGFYFTFWDKWMGTEHPRYKQEFRKNAQPIRLPKWLKSSPAERIAVTVMALFTTTVALGAPFFTAEMGIA